MDKLLMILQSFNRSITIETKEKLVTDGIIDSVDIVSLIAELEDTFNIEVPMEEIVEDNFDSVEVLWNMIQRLQ